MEEDQEQRCVCRFCNKSFCNGRSLGGHMRGHSALINAEKRVENDNGGSDCESEDTQKDMEVPEMDHQGGGAANYGLRENPKKSWRISESKHGGSKKSFHSCKQCGKGYPSLKALLDHRRSHSVKENEECIATVCRECGKEFHSMRALFGHMRHHPKELRVFKKFDYEIACPIRKKRSRTRYNKTTTPDPSYSCSPFVTITETDEVKEAAMCLMMLSRGVRSWDELNLVTDSFSNSTIVNLEVQSLLQSMGISGNEVGKCVSGSKIANLYSGFASRDDENKAELDATVEESLWFDRFKNRNRQCELESMEELESQVGRGQDDLGLGKMKPIKKAKLGDQEFEFKGVSCDVLSVSKLLKDFERISEFKCTTCDKVFHSHQAHGGHRANHKTVNGCIELKVESCKKSAAAETSPFPVLIVDTELEKLECDDKSIEQESGGVEVTNCGLKKSTDHECSICFKVFASGQALGGHKRAHYIGLNERVKETILDLNFSETLEEKPANDIGLKPWWANDHPCESLAIFN